MSLDFVKNIARDLGLRYDTLEVSTRKDKRFSILNSKGKKIHFGAKNGQTYIDHFDTVKRHNWYLRHKKNILDENPGYFSAKLLWPLDD